MVPAVEFASLLIPELTERGSGGPLFAGRLSSVVPLPPLGGLALASAALRNYAITLNAALQPAGIYAGTITHTVRTEAEAVVNALACARSRRLHR